MESEKRGPLQAVIVDFMDTHGSSENARIIHLIRARIRNPNPAESDAAWKRMIEREPICFDKEDADKWPQFVAEDQSSEHTVLPVLIAETTNLPEVRALHWLIKHSIILANQDVILAAYDKHLPKLGLDPQDAALDIEPFLMVSRAPAA